MLGDSEAYWSTACRSACLTLSGMAEFKERSVGHGCRRTLACLLSSSLEGILRARPENACQV